MSDEERIRDIENARLLNLYTVMAYAKHSVRCGLTVTGHCIERMTMHQGVSLTSNTACSACSGNPPAWS